MVVIAPIKKYSTLAEVPKKYSTLAEVPKTELLKKYSTLAEVLAVGKGGEFSIPSGFLQDTTNLNIPEVKPSADVLASLENLKNQGISSLASATNQDEFFKAQQKLFETQQKELEETKTEQKGYLDKLKDFFAGTKTQTELLEEQQAKYKMPEMWSNIQTLIPEIGALNTELANLKTMEATEVSGIQQNPQYSLQFATGEANRVSKLHAIKQAGVSAEIGAKTALMQAYQGNITTARTLISDVVSAMQYDDKMKLTGITSFMDANQDFINNLDKSQQNLVNDIKDYWTNKTKTDEQDYRDKLDLIVSAAGKGVNLGVGVADVKKMSLEEITNLYQEKVSGVAGKRTEIIGTAETGYQLITYDDKGNVIKTSPISGFGALTTGMTPKQQEALVGEMGFLNSFNTRDEAFQYLDRNASALKLALGDKGYLALRLDAESKFPKAEPITPTQSFWETLFGGGSIAPSITPTAGGGFEELGKAAETYSPLDFLKKSIPK